MSISSRERNEFAEMFKFLWAGLWEGVKAAPTPIKVLMVLPILFALAVLAVIVAVVVAVL